jgi:hypothetical protein
MQAVQMTRTHSGHASATDHGLLSRDVQHIRQGRQVGHWSIAGGSFSIAE